MGLLFFTKKKTSTITNTFNIEHATTDTNKPTINYKTYWNKSTHLQHKGNKTKHEACNYSWRHKAKSKQTEIEKVTD